MEGSFLVISSSSLRVNLFEKSRFFALLRAQSHIFFSEAFLALRVISIIPEFMTILRGSLGAELREAIFRWTLPNFQPPFLLQKINTSSCKIKQYSFHLVIGFCHFYRQPSIFIYIYIFVTYLFICYLFCIYFIFFSFFLFFCLFF